MMSLVSDERKTERQEREIERERESGDVSGRPKRVQRGRRRRGESKSLANKTLTKCVMK
jgi:hypothetical protein